MIETLSDEEREHYRNDARKLIKLLIDDEVTLKYGHLNSLGVYLLIETVYQILQEESVMEAYDKAKD
jgi:hypothetical protein